jgi:hypothetical protein
MTLLAGADFRAAHGSSKERSKDAEVEQPGYQGYKTDDGYDDATSTMDAQQAPGNQGDACDNSDDPTGGGSHKLYKGVHFISPI